MLNYSHVFCLRFNLLRRLFEFRKFVSNRDTCYNLIPRDYPVQITRVRSSPFRIIWHNFLSLKLRLNRFTHAFTGRKNFRMLARWWWISYTDGAVPSGCGSNRMSTFPFPARFATEVGRWKVQTNLHAFCWYWWPRTYKFIQLTLRQMTLLIANIVCLCMRIVLLATTKFHGQAIA